MDDLEMRQPLPELGRVVGRGDPTDSVEWGRTFDCEAEGCERPCDRKVWKWMGEGDPPHTPVPNLIGHKARWVKRTIGAWVDA